MSLFCAQELSDYVQPSHENQSKFEQIALPALSLYPILVQNFSLEKILILLRTGNIVKCMELQEIWALDFSRFSCVNIQSVSKSEALMVRANLIKMRVSHKLGTVVDHFDMIRLWSLVFSTILAQRNDCCEHLEVRFHQSWHERFDSYLIFNQGNFTVAFSLLLRSSLA